VASVLAVVEVVTGTSMSVVELGPVVVADPAASCSRRGSGPASTAVEGLSAAHPMGTTARRRAGAVDARMSERI